MVMQVFRYMAFIWEDYEKEAERQQTGISRSKSFRYPPILPIVFYDGEDNWTAAVSLHDRVLLSDILGEYIPNYRCILLQLRDYSHAELMEKKDELSIVMMINKLHKAADFTTLAETVSGEYVRDITLRTPEYLLDIMAQVVEILLLRINVPREEAADFAEQVKERRMGELFANFEAYDVQATRREAHEEGRKEGREEGHEAGWQQAYEEGIKKLIQVCRNLGITKEMLKKQLMEEYAISAAEADGKIEKYW